MPTEVTCSIPVTARFDGCLCDHDCQHAHNEDWCRLDEYTDRPSRGCIGFFQDTYIRTRWCCETFGMGEQVEEPPVMQPLEDWMLE